MLIQPFVSEFFVQAFYESVLRRLPWLDKRLPNSVFLGPLEHGLPGKLRTVIQNQRFRKLALLAKLGQKTRHAVP